MDDYNIWGSELSEPSIQAWQQPLPLHAGLAHPTDNGIFWFKPQVLAIWKVLRILSSRRNDGVSDNPNLLNF